MVFWNDRGAEIKPLKRYNFQSSGEWASVQLGHIDSPLITVTVCAADSRHTVCYNAEQAAARSTSRNYDGGVLPVQRVRRCGNKTGQSQTPFRRLIGWLEAGANMTQSLSWMPAAKLLYSSKGMCVSVHACVRACVCVLCECGPVQ